MRISLRELFLTMTLIAVILGWFLDSQRESYHGPITVYPTRTNDAQELIPTQITQTLPNVSTHP